MQDPLKPLDDGKVRLPKVDGAMNKIAPTSLNDDRDKKIQYLRSSDQQQAEEDSEILSRARKRFDRCIAAESDNRRDGLDDDKFYAGDQWPADVRARRNSERRPCVTINKFTVLIKQITGDQRQNRPTIDIHPVGDRSDVGVAKIYRGLIRGIERESHADQAYDCGFESGARKGWGYWRILPEYESPDTFDQVLRIKRVRNAYSVYMDPDDQSITGAESNFGFVTGLVDRDEFKEQYPDANPMPYVQGGFGDSLKNWINEGSLRVAEYYEKKFKSRELVLLSNGFEGWRDELSREALSQYEVVDSRRSITTEIWWYKITAAEVLERTQWLSRWIPIVKVIGDEIDIEGRVKLWGIVRQAKDAQRSVNYFRSAEIERVALAPKAPFIGAAGQFEGFEGQWQTANVKSHAYLPYNPTDIHGHMVPPPQRQPPPGVDAGDFNIAQSAAQDMLATTGVRFDATLNERTYDESGRALRELRRSGDIGSFNLVDNLMHSLRHTGEILVDAIPKYYTRPGRVLTILREDDSEEQVRVDRSGGKPVTDSMDYNTQRVIRAFDPTYGHYGVTVTIGPSYATRRIETAESMMDFLRAVPTAAPVIADLVAKNQDWEGAEEISTRLAKMLPPGINQPEMRDVSPQVQAVLVQMQQALQRLTQERQMLTAQLNDREKDRALARERINRQFEAQLLGIVQKAQAAAQKVSAEDRRNEAENVHDMAVQTLNLFKDLMKDEGKSDSRPNVDGGGTPTPSSSFPDARRAPDGNWYIPDPSRPGKYVMVK